LDGSGIGRMLPAWHPAIQRFARKEEQHARNIRDIDCSTGRNCPGLGTGFREGLVFVIRCANSRGAIRVAEEEEFQEADPSAPQSLQKPGLREASAALIG
jgi:hypothetical protein